MLNEPYPKVEVTTDDKQLAERISSIAFGKERAYLGYAVHVSKHIFTRKICVRFRYFGLYFHHRDASL